MGLLREAIDSRQESRAFGEEAARIPGPTEGYRTNAGVVVTEDSAIYHIDVFKNISLIADAIGMLPIRAFRNEAIAGDDGQIRIHARKLPRQPQVLVDPMGGGPDTEFSFKHRVMCSLLSNGNTYNEIAAVDGQGIPSVVMPIDPAKVREVRTSRSGLVEYVMVDGGILGHVRDGGTMLHWPGFVKSGALKGISPIAAGMQGISLGMAAEKYGARWFGGGANPTAILKDPRPREEIDEEEAADAKRKWVATLGGLSLEPMYTYGGLEFETIQIAPEESQFIETRKLQGAQIAGLFRNPPHMVSDVDRSTSWGTGLEEQGIGFVVFTLGPWITRFEQAFSWLLPRGQFTKFNVGALLRGKILERYQAYAIARTWGWMSSNDILELEDRPPIAGGDTYLQPLNMIDASAALKELMANPPSQPATEE